MFCKKCGKELNPSAKFCPGCGQKVQLSVPTPEAVVEEVKEEPVVAPVLEPVTEEVKEEPKNICPSCGNNLMPGVKFCNKCGQIIDANIPPMPPKVDNVSNNIPVKQPKKEKKGNGGAIAVVIVVILLLVALIGGGAFFWVKGGKEMIMSKLPNKQTAEKTSDEKEGQSEAEGTEATSEEGQEESEELDQSKKDIFEYLISSVSEDTDIDEIERTLENVIAFAKENNAGEYVTSNISDVYDIYLSNITDSISNLESQDARPAVYLQMKMSLEDAIEVAEEMNAAGINVDYQSLQDKEAELANYKELLIKEFDKVADENISQNGSVSRSSMWSVMENCDKTDLFSKSDVEDELNIRYMIALALHVDNELEKMSEQEAIKELKEKIKETDYNPLLVYYLAENYGDKDAKECLNFINSVIPEFAKGDIAQKRNFIYEFKDNAEARKEIREYMQGHF